MQRRTSDLNWAFGLRMLACTLALSLSAIGCGGDPGNDAGDGGDDAVGEDTRPDVAPSDLTASEMAVPPDDPTVGPDANFPTPDMPPPPYVRGSLRPVFELPVL